MCLTNFKSILQIEVKSIYTDLSPLSTGIRYEKCVVRRFRYCANVTECTYTNVDSIAY